MEIESPITSVKLDEYEFCLGDTVVTTDGIVGKIIGFCDCDECRNRGFPELFWEDEDSEQLITIHSVKNDLRGFHRIGKHLLHPFDKDWIESEIEKLNAEASRCADSWRQSMRLRPKKQPPALDKILRLLSRV